MNNKPLFLLITLVLTFGRVMHAQTVSECGDANFSSCSNLLAKFTLAKSISIKPSMYKYGGEKKEFSYFFSKGSTYVITLCDNNPVSNKVLVDLFDKNKRLIARNYDQTTKKYFNKIYFPCSATGVYYLKYSFQGGKPTCAVSELGVQNHIIKKL